MRHGDALMAKKKGAAPKPKKIDRGRRFKPLRLYVVHEGDLGLRRLEIYVLAIIHSALTAPWNFLEWTLY